MSSKYALAVAAVKSTLIYLPKDNDLCYLIQRLPLILILKLRWNSCVSFYKA